MTLSVQDLRFVLAEKIDPFHLSNGNFYLGLSVYVNECSSEKGTWGAVNLGDTSVS